MAAIGTIALNANSMAVIGTGTKFTTEAQVGGALVTYIGNVPYTFVIDSIASDTALNLTTIYQGSNVTGQSFSLLDRGAYTGVSAELATGTALAIRKANYDKINWQQLLTVDGDVTVKIDDYSQYTGPSWLSLYKSLALKANQTDVDKKANQTDVLLKSDNLSSIKDKDASRKNLGLGGAAVLDVGSSKNTVAAGDDSRLKTVDGKSGGTISSLLNVKGNSSAVTTYGDTSIKGNNLYSGEIGAYFDGWGAAQGKPGAGMYLNVWNQVGGAMNGNITLISTWTGSQTWTFNTSGNASAPGSWINNSDVRIKDNIRRILSPLFKMPNIRGVTWDRLDGYSSGIGFIAQSVQKDFPSSVFESGDRTLIDGTLVEGVLSPDTSGVAAALHQEAILQLMSIQRKALLTLADSSLSEADKQSALKELATLIPDESEYAEQ